MPQVSIRATRRFNRAPTHCSKCSMPLPSEWLFSRVDESNHAISASAPYLCVSCYRAAYPKGHSREFYDMKEEKFKNYLTQRGSGV